MKDVFITSTLKSEWNRNFNPQLCRKLEEKGVNCHLPQRDTKQDGSELDKYNQNIQGIKNSKKVIYLTTDDHSIPVMSLGMYENIIKVKSLDNFNEYIDNLVKVILE